MSADELEYLERTLAPCALAVQLQADADDAGLRLLAQRGVLHSSDAAGAAGLLMPLLPPIEPAILIVADLEARLEVGDDEDRRLDRR